MKILEEIISIIKDLKKEIEQKYKAEIMGIFGLSQEKSGKRQVMWIFLLNFMKTQLFLIS